MKRTALSFFGRKLYSNKIKSYESKALEIYSEDWSDKPWEDFAKDCFKCETEIREVILKSTGTNRMESVCALQAIYNIREEELNFVGEKVQGMTDPTSELKLFFESEYKSILKEIRELDFSSALDVYTIAGDVGNSRDRRKNHEWKHVSALLMILAVEEAFGNDLINLERNIRAV
ncbi:hypothetical protein [Nonlabens sp.]|uniref:hypothetical protein n=1 Tax=Nonlabens sp. TaxID=1888209 RepID=UPI0025FD14DD|nr:hypothetical protein [Nonlabens sp.]